MTHVPRANVWRDPHVHRVSLSASCSVRVSLSLHRNPIPARSFGRGICAHTVALGILIIIPFFDFGLRFGTLYAYGNKDESPTEVCTLALLPRA